MTNISSKHYYEDGDILLIVENVSFRVHRLILSLASPVFKDIFTLSTVSKDKLIPEIELKGDSVIHFELLLDYIYPASFASLEWLTVVDFLKLGDKYLIESVKIFADQFLKLAYQNNPLDAFLLADKYSLTVAFKESSKLVFETLSNCATKSTFRLLSGKTKAKVFETFWRYEQFLRNLATQGIYPKYSNHSCRDKKHSWRMLAEKHDEEANIELKKRIIQTLSSPDSKPSNVWDILTKDYCQSDDRFKNCYAFKNVILQQLYGFENYQPLELKESPKKMYLYVQLTDIH
ncbi:hypothetical protein G9A89_010591 [Geosiphon pyriformis]|nr:hypothetical protein G9A89_010591 [Geosiphon pyriformis]